MADNPNFPPPQKDLVFELDGDKYPTENTIVSIPWWNYQWGHKELMQHVAPLFNDSCGSCHFDEDLGQWRVTTGGWSGCEEVIHALQLNTMFWVMCWVSSTRGGLHFFETKS